MSTALRAAHLQPRSALDGLGRYLAKMDPGVGLDAHSLRQLARSTRPVWPTDLVFLATLADQLEQDVAKARRDAMHYNMSAGARAALQQEGGLLLIEAGYLRDLHARLSS